MFDDVQVENQCVQGRVGSVARIFVSTSLRACRGAGRTSVEPERADVAQRVARQIQVLEQRQRVELRHGIDVRADERQLGQILQRAKHWRHDVHRAGRAQLAQLLGRRSVERAEFVHRQRRARVRCAPNG